MGRMMVPVVVLFGFSLLVAAAAASGSTAAEADVHRFQEWLSAHGKSYPTDEEWQMRLEVYSANVKSIEEFNRNKEAAGRTYSLGEGPFTDLTQVEFAARLTSSTVGSPRPAPRLADDYYTNASTLAPAAVDWRAAGVVTAVKAQASCASCWAFAAVAAVESVHGIRTGEVLSLSEQEVIDCAQSGDCTGGWAWRAFRWIAETGGVTTEDEYEYTAAQGTCDSTKFRAATITGYKFVQPYSEISLRNAVARQPVVVSINSSPAFQHYTGGVFNGECGGDLNHDITLVGYGEDEYGYPFWLGKNSWGLEWGDNGYVYLRKDVAEPGGLCGLTIRPVFPTVA